MKREEYHKINSQQSTVNKLESFYHFNIITKVIISGYEKKNN